MAYSQSAASFVNLYDFGGKPYSQWNCLQPFNNLTLGNVFQGKCVNEENCYIGKNKNTLISNNQKLRIW